MAALESVIDKLPIDGGQYSGGPHGRQHLRENLEAAALELPDQALAALDSVGVAAA